MSDFLTTFLIIMSEAAAFFAIVIIFALVYRIRSGITLKRTAKEFVKTVKGESQEHSSKLKSILLDEYNMDEASAAAAVEKFTQHENILYSSIIELYLGDKNANLDDINHNVKNLTNMMHTVTVVNSSDESSPITVENEDLTNKVSDLEKQIEQLGIEKKQAQDQLQDAMDTMEGMMTEYASMYAGGIDIDKMNPDEDIARVKDKISEIKEKNKLTSNADSSENPDVDLNIDVPDLDIDEPDKE